MNLHLFLFPIYLTFVSFKIYVFFFIYSDKGVKRHYYKLLCLPLLPPKHIRLAFEKIKLQAEAHQMLKGYDGAFDRFLKYYRHQWLERVRNDTKITHTEILIIIEYK